MGKFYDKTKNHVKKKQKINKVLLFKYFLQKVGIIYMRLVFLRCIDSLKFIWKEVKKMEEHLYGGRKENYGVRHSAKILSKTN